MFCHQHTLLWSKEEKIMAWVVLVFVLKKWWHGIPRDPNCTLLAPWVRWDFLNVSHILDRSSVPTHCPALKCLQIKPKGCATAQDITRRPGLCSAMLHLPAASGFSWAGPVCVSLARLTFGALQCFAFPYPVSKSLFILGPWILFIRKWFCFLLSCSRKKERRVYCNVSSIS